MNAGDYVWNPGLQCFPPPITCGDVHLYAWFVLADLDKLNAWCDERFNRPSGGALNYRALSPFVMITFQEIERLQSQTSPAKEMGYVSEMEACVWVGVGQVDDEGLPIRDLAFALPWIWPDCGMAVTTGRELYGFRKTMSWITMPTESEQPQSTTPKVERPNQFEVETLAFATFSPETHASRHRVLRVERVEPPIGPPPEDFGDPIEDLIEELKDATSVFAPVAELLNPFARLKVPMVFLKQYRGVGTPHGTCYQAVTECAADNLKIDAIRPVLGLWKLYLADLASQPVAEQLGIKTDADGWLKVPGPAIRIDYSFDLDEGRVIWDGTTESS